MQFYKVFGTISKNYQQFVKTLKKNIKKIIL